MPAVRETLGSGDTRAHEVAQKLHAHSVQYAHKLVTTRRAMENSYVSHSQVLEPGASNNPPEKEKRKEKSTQATGHVH
eukprot:501479-Pelagomonas_calceolata.AAC.1